MDARTGERAGAGWGPAGTGRGVQPRSAARGWPRPPAAGGCSAASALRRPAGRGARGRLVPPGRAGCAGLRRGERCTGLRGREAGSHALHCRSAASAAAVPQQRGRGLLPSPGCGLGFSTLGFVSHFLLSCERLTSAWSPVYATPCIASPCTVTLGNGEGWTPANVLF